MTTILAIDADKNTFSTITETYVTALNHGVGAFLWVTSAPLLDNNGDHRVG